MGPRDTPEPQHRHSASLLAGGGSLIRRGITLIILVLMLAIAACGSRAGRTPETSTTASDPQTEWLAQTDPCSDSGFATDCEVPGYSDRPFDIDVPSSYDSKQPTSLLVVLHGGGGNSETARQRACADGELDSESCFKEVGEREGFITVYPNGTGGRLASELRTWNAGGGGPDHACVSGRACEAGIDDISYVSALLDELTRQFNIDQSRVYVTGFSNGAAMAHRIACEMSERVAAIAPVAGANQYATTGDCNPSAPVAVLHVHGTADPCWTYEESSEYCLEKDDRPKVSVAGSTRGWVDRLECEPDPVSTTVEETADDGMSTIVDTWSSCRGGAEVRLMTVDGGGHAYPGGSPGRERIVGSPTHDWGFEEIWEFLSRFPAR